MQVKHRDGKGSRQRRSVWLTVDAFSSFLLHVLSRVSDVVFLWMSNETLTQ